MRGHHEGGIENFFHEVTHMAMGLETHHFLLFEYLLKMVF